MVQTSQIQRSDIQGVLTDLYDSIATSMASNIAALFTIGRRRSSVISVLHIEYYIALVKIFILFSLTLIFIYLSLHPSPSPIANLLSSTIPEGGSTDPSMEALVFTSSSLSSFFRPLAWTGQLLAGVLPMFPFLCLFFTSYRLDSFKLIRNEFGHSVPQRPWPFIFSGSKTYFRLTMILACATLANYLPSLLLPRAVTLMGITSHFENVIMEMLGTLNRSGSYRFELSEGNEEICGTEPRAEWMSMEEIESVGLGVRGKLGWNSGGPSMPARIVHPQARENRIAVEEQSLESSGRENDPVMILKRGFRKLSRRVGNTKRHPRVSRRDEVDEIEVPVLI
jgi:hypothetical protein